VRNNAERSVLITGCSSGIGLATARGLRARRYRVVASARKASDVARLRAEGFEAVRLDVDDDASIAAALDEVLTRTGGRLYGLFNNGAYGQPGAVEDLRREVLRAQFETAVLGWHELTRRVIPVMRAQGEGRIIHNSSVLGLVAFAYRGAYVAAKFALEGLTDTLRLELHGTGVQVSLIEPGPVLSRFRDNAYRKFTENIDVEASPHRDRYRAMAKRLTKEGARGPAGHPRSRGAPCQGALLRHDTDLPLRHAAARTADGVARRGAPRSIGRWPAVDPTAPAGDRSAGRSGAREANRTARRRRAALGRSHRLPTRNRSPSRPIPPVRHSRASGFQDIRHRVLVDRARRSRLALHPRSPRNGRAPSPPDAALPVPTGLPLPAGGRKPPEPPRPRSPVSPSEPPTKSRARAEPEIGSPAPPRRHRWPGTGAVRKVAQITNLRKETRP
jgi:NAD(P)-dependent dehydrogenase (short-subunit alcohol dehydrogenase family)